MPIAGAVDILAVSPKKSPVQVEAPAAVAAPEKPVAKTAAAKKAEDLKLAAAEKKAAETAKATKKAADEIKAKAAAKKAEADAKKAEAKKLASQPSRIWVQIGVGRDKAAIAFDWRKFNKDHAAAFKGRQAFVSDMGRTNRMLVGPFATQKAASAFLAELKAAKFDRGFIWTSAAGQAVDPLAGK